MSSIILGTGASEAIPCGYCECSICNEAREHKGKNIRTRSDFLIDETSIIDYSPDLFYQLLQCGITLRKLKNIFITHFHEDHVNIPEMGCRNSGQPALEEYVDIYGSHAALEQIGLLFNRYKDHTRPDAFNYFGKYKLNTLEPFAKYEIDNLKVTPILSSHYGYGVNEVGFNYIITRQDGKTFLYAADTGWYWKSTWDYFKTVKLKLDFVVIECTYGNYNLPAKQEGHLNIPNMLEMIETMNGIGMLSHGTPVYLTHICHLHTLNHKKTLDLFKECAWNIQVGYDGMKTV